jgi:D-tyrosyl-tRNA(Tyr) deacylase
VRVVVQRVTGARVSVAGEVVGALDGPGVCALVGVTHEDTAVTAQRLARKVAELRIMRDAGGAASGTGRADEASLLDVRGGALVISQFTLYGETRKGRRPSWIGAAPGPVAEPLVAAFADTLRGLGVPVATGRFGAEMAVELVNDGPMTVLLEL